MWRGFSVLLFFVFFLSSSVVFADVAPPKSFESGAGISNAVSDELKKQHDSH